MSDGPHVTINSPDAGMPARHAARRRGSAFPIVFGLTVLTTCVAIYDLLLFAAGVR